MHDKPPNAPQRSAAPDTDSLPSGCDILFLGDICFGASYRGSSFEERGFDSSFENLDGILQSADYVVANLETVLTTHKTSVLEGKKRYVHRDDPEAAAALKRHGIDLVSLANNHGFDYGTPGLTETLGALAAADVTAIGAGITVAEAAQPYVKVFHLRLSTFRLAIAVGKAFQKYSYDYYADENQAGINCFMKRSVAGAQIRRLREAEPNAFLVAFPHGGKNYRWKTGYQSKLARDMIRAGADLVIGHGAHCVQEIEKIEGRWVVHSIGNSVFNTPGRFQKYPDILPYSFIGRLCVTEQDSRQKVTLRLYPILSDNKRTNFKPQFASQSDLGEIRARLITRSNNADELDDALVSGVDDFSRFLELPITTRNMASW